MTKQAERRLALYRMQAEERKDGDNGRLSGDKSNYSHAMLN